MPGGTDFVALLIQGITQGQIRWNWHDDPQAKALEKWRAFRHGNRSYLMGIRPWKEGRLYRIDRLPGRASIAFADFMFGEDPLVTPAKEEDREALFDLLSANNFTGKLRQAVDTQVSEREVWWRVYVNPSLSEHACLEFHSRTEVIPYMMGKYVLAAAFLTTYYPSDAQLPVYRHLECHQAGFVRNILFRGAPQADVDTPREDGTYIDPTQVIGSMVPLTEHVMTAPLVEQWDHGLPILAGRLTNGEYPQSIYEMAEDHLLDLNEAHSIDAENFRLSGKKRAVMSKKFADQAGEADAGEEIYFTEDDGDEMEADKDPLRILEYEYDADASIKRKDDLERISLTRMGLARQLVDANANEGLAQTGTALRTRLLPTVAALKGAGKEWQDKGPTVVQRLSQADALSATAMGPGHSWKGADGTPGFKLPEPIPVDETEEAQRHQTLVTGELESIEEAVHSLHPDWPEDKKLLEIKRILANRAGYALDKDGNPIEVERPKDFAAPNSPDRPGGSAPSGANGGGPNQPPGETRAPASQQG